MTHLVFVSAQCQKKYLPKNGRGNIVMVPGTITMVPPNVPD